ncbi:MAG TPA: hypothetical protein VM847_16265 [Tahibacter sp.]|nr:hypothetical protein [Tahibacter sp.]
MARIQRPAPQIGQCRKCRAGGVTARFEAARLQCGQSAEEGRVGVVEAAADADLSAALAFAYAQGQGGGARSEYVEAEAVWRCRDGGEIVAGVPAVFDVGADFLDQQARSADDDIDAAAGLQGDLLQTVVGGRCAGRCEQRDSEQAACDAACRSRPAAGGQAMGCTQRGARHGNFPPDVGALLKNANG